jgi:hypothetical protein
MKKIYTLILISMLGITCAQAQCIQTPQPILECWETATWDATICDWEILGSQPIQPFTECWETAIWDATICDWTVTGSQPTEPITSSCWEYTFFNSNSCNWEILGTQPAPPNTECYENALFDYGFCDWVVTGTQPPQPNVACYETATFNNTTCTWDINGTQPMQPTTACYETATFNSTTCTWDITGTQPTQPTIACYETATFNNATCTWDITGTQPTQPIVACYEIANFDSTSCSWVVTSNAPTLACNQSAVLDSVTCTFTVLTNNSTSGNGLQLTYCLNDTAITLSGTAASGSSTGLWTFISGPNTPTIFDNTSNSSSITNLSAGNYKFEWAITTGACTTYDTITVTINAAPTLLQQSPISFVCAGTTVVIAAEVRSNDSGASADVGNLGFTQVGFTNPWPLALTKITVPNGGYLTDFIFEADGFNDPGTSVTMALYSEAGGLPNVKIAEASAAVLSSGNNYLPAISSLYLNAGTYFVARQVNGATYLNTVQGNDTCFMSTVNGWGNPYPAALAGLTPIFLSRFPFGIKIFETTPVSFSWNSNPAINSSQFNIANVTINNSTTFNYTATNAYNCAYNGALAIAADPIANVQASNDTLVCVGSTLQLFATGGVNYEWNNLTAYGDSINVNTSVAGTYTNVVTGYNGFLGCPASDTSIVTVVANPSSSILGNNFLCGTSTQLMADAGTSYSWFKDGILQANDTTSTYTASSNGVYHVLINNQGCTSDTTGNGFTLTKQASASETFIIKDSVCSYDFVKIQNTDTTCIYYNNFSSEFDLNVAGNYSLGLFGDYGTVAQNASNDTLIFTSNDASNGSNFGYLLLSKLIYAGTTISFDYSFTTDSIADENFEISFRGLKLVPYAVGAAPNSSRSGSISYVTQLAGGLDFAFFQNNNYGGAAVLKIYNLQITNCKPNNVVTYYADSNLTNQLAVSNYGYIDFSANNLNQGASTIYALVSNGTCDTVMPLQVYTRSTPTIIQSGVLTPEPNSGFCPGDQIEVYVQHTGAGVRWLHNAQTEDTTYFNVSQNNDASYIVIDSTGKCSIPYSVYVNTAYNPNFTTQILLSNNGLCAGDSVNISVVNAFNTPSFSNGFMEGVNQAVLQSDVVSVFMYDSSVGCNFEYKVPIVVKEEGVLDSLSASKNPICKGERVQLQAHGSLVTAYHEQSLTYSKETPIASPQYLVQGGLVTHPIIAEDLNPGLFAAYPLPFKFKFYNKTYDSIYIGTNGYVSFDSTDIQDTYGSGMPLPNTSDANPRASISLATVYCNAVVGGYISTFTNGSAPNRKFIVEYCLPYDEDYRDTLKGQIILHEGSNDITLNIDSVNSIAADYDVTIGIQDASGTNGQCVDNFCTQPVVVHQKSYLLSPINDTTSNIWNSSVALVTAEPNTYFASSTPDSTNTYYVNYNVSGCMRTDSIVVQVNELPIVQALSSSMSLCAQNSVTLSGNGASTYLWDNAVVNDSAFVPTRTRLYTVIGTDTFTTCSNTDTITVTVDSSTTVILDLALGSNLLSVAGSDSNTQVQPDSSSINYVSSTCGIIATVDDASGGNVLGSTTAVVTVDNNVPIFGTQPYVPRWYTITPTNQGAATVTLYFTQADFDAYNTYATNSGWPLLPLIGDNTDPNIANIRITKVSGGALGVGTNVTVITPTSLWDATHNYWSLSFNVTSFSGFYVHGVNPANAPLNIASILSGKATTIGNELSWQTQNVGDVVTHDILHSTDGTTFTKVAQVAGSKNSYVHQQVNFGNNFYQIQSTNATGQTVNSNIIDLHRNGSDAQVLVYPNPATTTLNVQLQGMTKKSTVDVNVMDATGKILKQTTHTINKDIEEVAININALASGIYYLSVRQTNGMVHVQKWHKD